MWTIAIVVLWVNGAMGKSMCTKPHFVACVSPFPFEIPGTTRELNEICPLVVNYVDCLKNYENTCKDKGLVFRHLEYDDIRSLVVDVCSNGTRLNTVLFQNLKCIRDLVKNGMHECNEYGYQVLNAYQEFKNATKELEETRTARIEESCLITTYDLGCFMASASTKCGPMVKDALIEGINRSHLLNYICSIETMNDLKGIVNSLKISDAQRNILSETLSALEGKA